MPKDRRPRPTIRCLTRDLGIPLPGLDVDLGKELDEPLMDELRRIAPDAPTGQKRVLSIDHPLVYRIRVSAHRGATWVDEDHGIVWLCAARRREDGSAHDAFAWFADLHAMGQLLPTADDRRRDRAEAAIRVQRGLTAELLHLFDQARADKGADHHADLGDWLPCRMLVIGDDVEEIWCALSVRAADGTGVSPVLRDLLFAALERHVAPAVFEGRDDWPAGPVEWFEVVRLGIR
jgi:hypothetical protein